MKQKRYNPIVLHNGMTCFWWSKMKEPKITSKRQLNFLVAQIKLIEAYGGMKSESLFGEPLKEKIIL